VASEKVIEAYLPSILKLWRPSLCPAHPHILGVVLTDSHPLQSIFMHTTTRSNRFLVLDRV
jgi:hypothetical protein